MHQQTMLFLFQVMFWRPFDATALPEPIEPIFDWTLNAVNLNQNTKIAFQEMHAKMSSAI